MRSRAPLLVWLAMVALCATYLAFAIDVDSDLAGFLPAPADSKHALLLAELQQGRGADILLLALEGDTPATRAAYSEQLAEALRRTPLISAVYNNERALDEAAQALLFRYRYLLVPELDLSPEALRAELLTRLEELSAPLPPPHRHQFSADPTASYGRVLAAARPSVRPRQAEGVWVSPDGGRALLLVELRGRGLDARAQGAALTAIDAAFAQLAAPPELGLRISGPARFAVQAAHTIQREAQLFSILGSALLMGLLLLVYRSWRMVLLSALPLASALLAGIAAVTWLFGSIHGITLAFGITLLGVAIDYPLHLFSQHRITPGPRALRAVWPTLRLSIATTLVAYFSLALTDFTGLAQLGTLACVGLITAALVTRWVLPALLGVPAAGPADDERAAMTRLPAVPNARWVVPAMALAIPSVFLILILSAESVWEHDLAALSPIPAAERALDRELRLQLGAPEPGQLILVHGASAQQALARSETVFPLLDDYRAQGLLADYEAAARYLPSAERQRQRAQALPGADALQGSLDAAQAGLPFRAQAFAPFVAEVRAARELAPLTPAELRGTALDARLQGQLFKSEQGWWALILLVGVEVPQALSAQFRAVAPEHVHYLDLREAGAEMVNAFRAEALTRLGWGGLAMLALLTLGLRSVRAASMVAAPVVLASLATVSTLVALGQPLSLFHLIALLLVAGIGLDYSLFFRRRFLETTAGGATLHALWVCLASTLSVFGILALSQLPVLHAIGRTVAIGVAFSFVLSYYFAAHAQPVRMRVRGQDGLIQEQDVR